MPDSPLLPKCWSCHWLPLRTFMAMMPKTMYTYFKRRGKRTASVWDLAAVKCSSIDKVGRQMLYWHVSVLMSRNEIHGEEGKYGGKVVGKKLWQWGASFYHCQRKVLCWCCHHPMAPRHQRVIGSSKLSGLVTIFHCSENSYFINFIFFAPCLEQIMHVHWSLQKCMYVKEKASQPWPVVAG